MTTPFLVGISGGTGSGKTTVAHGIAREFTKAGVGVLEEDSYYLDQSHLSEQEREIINYDEPSAIDHNLLFDHLIRLLKGQSVRKPLYSFATHTRIREGEIIESKPIIVLEGLFTLRDPQIRSLLNLKVFLEAAADIRFIRRLQRDVEERGRTVESVVTQYLRWVRPMYARYVEPQKAHADLVVNTTESSDEGNQLIYRAVAEGVSASRRTFSGGTAEPSA